MTEKTFKGLQTGGKIMVLMTFLVLLTGAMIHALNALRLNWIADEFSITGRTEVTVVLPGNRRITLPIKDLYDLLHEDGSAQAGEGGDF